MKELNGFSAWRKNNPQTDDEEQGKDKQGEDEQGKQNKKKKKSKSKSAAQNKRNKEQKNKMTGRKRDGAMQEASKYLCENGLNSSIEDIITHIQSKGMSISPATAANTIRRMRTVISNLLDFGWPTEAQAREMIEKKGKDE